MTSFKLVHMKKLLIVLALSSALMACNSGSKNEVADDTTETGENPSAAAQQSSVDTNATKIGTDAAPADTSKKDSVQ